MLNISSYLKETPKLLINVLSSYIIVYPLLTQISPQSTDVVEIFIYLGEPCHVCQLLLTISHGADDSTYPSTVDVRTGRHLDGLKLVLEVCIWPPLLSNASQYT